MEFWVVVTVFQGVLDAVKPFATEKEADDYVVELKADYGEDEDLDITKLLLTIP